MSAREDGLQQLSLPDMERRLANTVRYGTIMAVDLPNKRVRVKSGEIETTWLPWPAGRAGAGKRRWDPPEVGEQVAMLAPSGDLRQAMVIPGLYQSAHDAPSADANEDQTVYSDGTVIGYNRGTHTLTANLGDSSLVMTRTAITLTIGSTVLTLTASGATLEATQLTVDAPNSTFTGNVLVQGALAYQGGLTGSGGAGASMTGNLSVTGNVSNTGTLTNNGKNVGSTHTHSGVTAGGGTTGAPT